MEKTPIGKQINIVARLFQEKSKKEAYAHGVNLTYFYILKFLKNNQDIQVTQKMLCDYLGHKPSSISVTLTNMQSEHLIKKEKSKQDVRKTIVTLDDKGLDSLKEITKAHQKIDNLIIDVLGDDYDCFYELLEKIKDRLEEQ